jgi:general stress protein 26
MVRTLSDIATAMRDIDFCMLTSRGRDGSIAGRPMSNNREVEYSGENRFFTYEDRRIITDIERDGDVGASFQGGGGLLGIVGKPGIFIHVEGVAEIVRDRSSFTAHWDASLDRWFPQGPDTPGVVMIVLRARRIHYWDGEEEGEVELPPAAGPT